MDTTKFNETENLLDDETLEGMIRFHRAKNLLLRDDSHDIEDIEIVYPSKMNEKNSEIIPNSHPNVLVDKEVEQKEVQPFLMHVTPQNELQIVSSNPTPNQIVSQQDYETSPFILANTEEVTLQHLKHDCIIPVFRDSEQTIAHFQLINTMQECIAKAFPYHSSDKPEIRVSHKVSGRIPEALHKPVKELLDNEKTLFWERMAFIIRIPSITDTINGNELTLTIGGIRSYKSSNLFNKKSMEHFKVFCGFQVKVCSNLCVWSDGFVDNLRASSVQELGNQILQLLHSYNAEKHLSEMKQLTDYSLTESQFASLIGRSRLYQHLPKSEKQKIPMLNFNDSHINTMAKDYYEDKNFCRLEDGRINLWDVYNLFTQANKSSYIDTFLDRNLNAFEFTKGIQKTLNGNLDYHWFLS